MGGKSLLFHFFFFFLLEKLGCISVLTSEDNTTLCQTLLSFVFKNLVVLV